MRALLSLGRLFLTVAALAAFTFPASGASVVIAPAKDNTLYESPAGTLSNGAGDFLFAGQTGPTDGVNIRRGLLAFDVAASIPAGAMVTNVSLTLFVTRVAAGGFNRQVSLSRVTGDWGEASSRAPSPEGSGGTALTGDATWRHQFFP